MKKSVAVLTVLFAVMSVGIVYAGGYSWNYHQAPFDFTFGNMIDKHQETMALENGKLVGFCYITPTGNVVDGIPEAGPGKCDQMPDSCSAGWLVEGAPVKAKLVSNDPMPTWCVDSTVLSNAQGYSHFHMVGEDGMNLTVGNEYLGYLLKLTAIDTFYFDSHCSGYTLINPGVDDYSHLNIVTNCNP